MSAARILITPRPVGVGLHEVVEIRAPAHRRNLSPPCCSSASSRALNGADTRGGDVAVLRLELASVVADVLENGLQVLHVQEEESVVIGDFKDQREDTFLRVVEIEKTREQQRTHFGDGGADGMPLGAEDIPEGNGIGGEGEFGKLELLYPGGEFGILLARLAMPARSPLMSAAKTQVPAAQKPSASFCRVTVLPVPVAPATSPWRLPKPA